MSIDFCERSDNCAGSPHRPLCAAAGLLKVQLRLLLLLLAVFAISTARMHAQLDTSTIAGVVTDHTGAVVPGTTVVITDAKTNRTFTTTTNSKGEYTAPFLSVSVYRLKFSRRGFRTTTIEGVILHASDSITENAVLDVGAVSETVTVNAADIQPDTETSNLGTTITADQVSQLPTNGRDIMDMLALVPGAIQNTGSAVNGDSMGGFATGQFGANVLLDGGDSTRVDGNLAFSTWGISNARITRSSIDNVQEVKVLSSDYSAEYGRSIGDIVNIITKSGTNDLHGEVFEFLRNDALDSKNWFNTGESVPLRLNQFGGNVGGPILRDKLFFFGNYEGDRQRVTNIVTGISLVLNDAMRATAVPAIQPILALIPEGSKDASGNYIPAQTENGINYGYWFNSLNGTTYSDLNENTYALKLDYVLSPKNNFAVRYNYNYSNTYQTYGLAIGQYENGRQLSQLAKATWNYTGSESFLNELGFNINSPRTVQQNGEPGMPSFGCFFCTVGLGITPSPDGLAFGAQAPNMSYELIDTATKIKGRNQFRFGTDMRWNGVGRSITRTEGITFSGGDFVAAANASGGPEGMLSNNGIAYSVQGYSLNWVHNANYDFFFNDIVKVRRNLSLNMGIRYEFNTVLHDANGVFENFDTDLAVFGLEKPGTQLYSPSHVDWAPRFGFNWDPYGKGLTTVKGGFGLFFMPIPSGTANNLAGNTELNENVNLLEIGLLGTEKCNPPVTTVTYPLPTTLPDCTEAGAKSVSFLDPHMRDSYSEQWSFSIDQQIAKNTVLTIAYRGNHGLRLPSGVNVNEYEAYEGNKIPPPNSSAPPRILSDACTAVQGTGPNATCGLWGDVSESGNFASSNYNALNVSVRANTHGLSVNANYNWSHEFDDALGLFEAYQNPSDILADWSEGDIDVHNTFAIGAIYNAPRIPIRFPRLGSGWQVSTITQGRSGAPVNFSYDFVSTDNITDYAAASLRPDCVPGVSWRAQHWSPRNQYNPAAFAEPALAWGNCPRNYGRGPSYIQADMALVKNTKLSEHLNWEFRGEVFNIPNHPNFANAGSSVNGYAFGSSYSTIGNLVGQGTSRQLQFSSKLTF